ncbi:MAG TPA: carbohydrate ABC transporter permease [Chloroflexia bacterium]|nr:carbohydrate ABC transporter permease [Chloroflexia bacterium]
MSQKTLQPEKLSVDPTLALSAGIEGRRRFVPAPYKVISYIIVLVFAILYIVPLLYLLNVALKSPEEFLNDPVGITKSLNWGNFGEAWDQAHFASYLLNSVIYTAASTFLHVLFALMVAYPIARGFVKWGGFLSTLFLASLFLPNNLIPQFQLVKALNLYNTQIGYILLTSSVGLAPFLIMGYLKTVPKELDEAAAIDGCGYFRCMFTIITPLIKPILITAAILHAIGVWNDIIGPTIYLTNPDYFPISLGLNAFKGEYSSNITGMGAATLIAIAPLIVVYLFCQKYFIEGAVAGAVK